MEDTAAIICAAGASTRFGGKKKKPFVEIKGRAAFLRSVEVFAELKDVKQIILAVSPEDVEMFKLKWADNLTFFGAEICLGGKERFETVQNALEKVDEDIKLVAVHDAARCCLTEEWAEAVIKKARETGAAMLACPVTDTVKKVKEGQIIDTIDRRDLYGAQTPQVFKKELLEKGFENLKNLDKNQISDDSQLVEALGEKVWIVETDTSNLKITTKADAPIAEAILKYRESKQKKRALGPFDEAQW